MGQSARLSTIVHRVTTTSLGTLGRIFRSQNQPFEGNNPLEAAQIIDVALREVCSMFGFISGF